MLPGNDSTPAHVIHLPSALEREPWIQRLETGLGWRLTWVEASDGSAWHTDPTIGKRHPWTGEPISRGNIGCTETHLRILQRVAASGSGAVAVIFEDDCELTTTGAEVDQFIRHVSTLSGERWDILLLGATEYVDFTPIDARTARVKRFWGTHAMILRPRAIEAALKAFQAFQAEGKFPPADWLYNRAIAESHLACYGPCIPRQLCRQVPGLVSAITGKVRG
jgi:GR25 family glycosyltransferase involved in LPS biosynthesis